MAPLTFNPPPQSLCIIRLSAIGDITHLLPVIATLQQQWPHTRITWIIGSTEYQLVKTLPGIDFIVFNKRNGLAEYRRLRRRLAGQRFDILLMTQVALRASLISLLIRARYKIGFDRARSRDFQHLFCNQRIEGPARVHVLDGFFQFLEKIGIRQRRMDWLIRAPEAERAFANSLIEGEPCVVINPSSSARKNNWRNWSIESYAEIIDHLVDKNIKVILSGGPAEQESRLAQRIIDTCRADPVNLVGKTTLAQLLAILEQSLCLIAPDTGPAHMGTVVGCPVVGLYASSNPLRTGPYNSQQTCINRYPQALQQYQHEDLQQARWGKRVRHPDVMQLITVPMVTEVLDDILRQASAAT